MVVIKSSSMIDAPAAARLLEAFLSRSPRPALEARVLLEGRLWHCRLGDACGVDEPVFEIGSVGKLLTTTLLAVLVVRGQLRLDDPVSRFCPELRFGARTTLEQLACHTSGLARDPVSGWQMAFRGRQVADAFLERDLEAYLVARPATLPATRVARYSNVGMALLGRILAQACGDSYEAAVREWVLRPLAMHDTRIRVDDYPEGRVLPPHDSRGRRLPPFTWKGMEPAGVWRSTSADLARFLQAMMGQGDDAWSPVAALAMEPRARAGRRGAVGLGWMLEEHRSWGRVGWHSGGTFGQHSMIACVPARRAAVVLLSNRAPPLWHHLLPSRRLEDLPEPLLHCVAGASVAR